MMDVPFELRRLQREWRRLAIMIHRDTQNAGNQERFIEALGMGIAFRTCAKDLAPIIKKLEEK